MKTKHTDIAPFIKFCFIGATNTALHSAILIIMHGFILIPVVLSHFFAFCIVNVISYALNSKLVFYKTLSFIRYIKFALVSVFALIVTLLIAALCEAMAIDYRIGLLVVIITTPPITFLLQKTFAFRIDE